MKFRYFFIIILGVMVFASCQATVPSMISFESKVDLENRMSEIPDHIPIYKNAKNYPADPLKVVERPLRDTDMIEVVSGTLQTNAPASVVYEWYIQEVQNLGWTLIDLMGYDGEVARIQAKRGDEFIELSILSETGTRIIRVTYLVTRDIK
ncbi:MAG: hypothetical protein R2883_04830 [Caldisericia bacterium]